MLSYLAVKNVSVIESVSFELGKGLTVLTGETGSGKSVLVNSLKLLLGERFQKTMLREGAEKLVIEGIFDDTDGMPAALKEEFNVEDELIVRREVNEAGKNRIFLNGIPATVAQLREFAPYLADIHGQHEHQSLLDESKHMDLLDHFVDKAAMEEFTKKYGEYLSIKSKRDKLIAEVGEVNKYQDIITFQLQEITQAAININTDSRINEQVNFLSHVEKIREACAASLDALSEGEMNVIEQLSKALRSMISLNAMITESAEVCDSLNEALFKVSEAAKTLTGLYERQEASPDELDRLIRRKYLLQDLVNKYGGTLESVVAAEAELKEKLNNFENSTDLLNALRAKAAKAKAEAQISADRLLAERKKAAEKIAVELQNILGELELPGSRFLTVFTQNSELNSRGGVEGKFYISVNAGFEPAPLAQVASGGEISRVMLALKEVFSKSDPVATLLFDEIDTGISGRTAKKVAQKLQELSKIKQVIVITHLPVVAAAGAAHFYISKEMKNNTTKTTIIRLGENERLRILASMIAGEATEAAVTQAGELINNTKREQR